VVVGYGGNPNNPLFYFAKNILILGKKRLTVKSAGIKTKTKDKELYIIITQKFYKTCLLPAKGFFIFEIISHH